eukprot:GHRR01015924.1.p1 GENE.GHRR01015924.1~~GHRR01015924.1.p1  ORF type:complete len:227 (+),score=72.08 GHRR01015924.1:180-860(+)
MQRLIKKAAVVTGGAKGIGFAVAQRLGLEGAAVMLGDIDDQAATEAVGRLKDQGIQATFTHCDVSQEPQVQNLIQQTIELLGGVDILVANAAAQQMVKQGRGGAIITMSSVNGVMAIPTIAGYNASKGGVDNLTRCMALALAPHNIRVNAIGPGSIHTDVLASVVSDKTAMEKVLSRTPLGRVGQPDEIGSVAAFLASDDASYMTGQVVYVDGGRMALNYTMLPKQ